MTIVNIQCNEEQRKEEATYKMGDCFLVGGDLCILAQVGYIQFKIIGLYNGNRYSDNVISPDDYKHITLEEIKYSLDEEYEVIPIRSVNISYEM